MGSCIERTLCFVLCLMLIGLLCPASADTVTITAGGDAVLGSEEKKRDLPYSFDSVLAARGYSWPFSGLSSIFSQDDITFVNLECVLKNSRTGFEEHLYNFRGLTVYTSVLTQGSVEIVNIANNHIYDYGDDGFDSTKTALRRASIAYSGYGETCVLEVRGHKIGFGGIRETKYKKSPKRMDKDIQALRDAGTEVIIYACHFGTEYENTHNALQTEMAHRAVELGADIVIGHHPHVVQGVEIYRNVPIFYSLGNLMFGGTLALTEFDGCLVSLNLLFDDQTNAYQGADISLIPILTSSSAPANDFHPVPATGDDRTRILNRMQEDTPFDLQNGIFSVRNMPENDIS